MLTVDDYELVRRKHLVDGMSQRAISRELGHARNTVPKAVANPIPLGYRLTEARGKPQIDPVKPIIDAWLDEDRTKPRKQRHTARRIFERLRDEHEFTGAACTVRRYVRQAKRCLKEVCHAPTYIETASDDGEEVTATPG